MTAVLLSIAALAGSLLAPDPPPTDAPSPEVVRRSMQRGIAFLLADQNADGSWGGPQDSLTTWSGDVWSNPETHRAWKVATTGLCCAALLEMGSSEDALAAADRGVRFLIDNADVKRPSEWDTMNNWAYIYGLQGLATAAAHPRYREQEVLKEIAAASPKYMAKLARFQSVSGGWGYLEFATPRTARPQWATSFMTASAVVAVESARLAGAAVDQPLVDRAVRIINHCRLPNGAYTYHVRNVPNLHSEYIDQVKGSLCRIAVCHAALLIAGQDIPAETLRTGMDAFFREHKFLELAMHKPVPHEAYYYNSGYFYMYGHYYAALVIERLSAKDQAVYWPKLQHEVMKVQQRDGSIWDYDVHRYDRPYGTAFGVMALGRSLPKDAPAKEGQPIED